MVRRRTRNKLAAVAACSPASNLMLNGKQAANAVALLEDQYFASPKRKDCKLDSPTEEADASALAASGAFTVKSPEKTKPTCSGKQKTERISGRTIGVPLATRSQTRTIENYFKAKTAAKNMKQNETEEKKTNNLNTLPATTQNHELTNDDDPQSQQQYSGQASPTILHKGELILPHAFLYAVHDDSNDSQTNTEVSDENASRGYNCCDFLTRRSPIQNDSHSSPSSSSGTSGNLFLQEPVLHLDVDKSLNQPSSIKINKTLDPSAVFSTPIYLNGRFNQIVSLNGASSPTKRDSFTSQFKPLNGFNGLLHDSDNSSCDSGVVFTALDNNNSPISAHGMSNTGSATRRRKPATPHRIVCPSPIKSAPHRISPTGGVACYAVPGRKAAASKEQLSPRKAQRYMSSVSGSKTRRRLNQQRETSSHSHGTVKKETELHNGYNQNGYIEAAHIEADDIVGKEDDLDFENLDDIESDLYGATLTTKLEPSPDELGAPDIKQLQQATKATAKPKSSAARTQPPKMKLQASQPLAATNGNREMTDFFPVRRSVRKTKSAVKEEMMRNLEKAVLEERAEGLKVAHFKGKGRGVVAASRFQRGEFVIEYVGDLISMAEAAEREKRYALDENAGCYMYYFKHENQQYCIDATIDTGKLGRLVNHSRNGNLITKVVVVKKRPHLILIAKDDIEPGEELTYDYGDRSKESLMHHPWLAF